jgi:hypothetical protein
VLFVSIPLIIMVHLDTTELGTTHAPAPAEAEQISAIEAQTEAASHEAWRLTTSISRMETRHYRERAQEVLKNVGNGKPLFNVVDYITVSEQPQAAPDAEDPREQTGTLIRVRTTLSGVWREQWIPTPFSDRERVAAQSADMVRSMAHSLLGSQQEA